MFKLSILTSTRSLSLTSLRTTVPRAFLPSHVFQAIPLCSHRCIRTRTTSTSSKLRWKWPVATLIFGSIVWIGYDYQQPIFEAVGAARAGNPLTFQPFLLKSKERVSSTSSIFTLVPATASLSWSSYDQAWNAGVWSMRIKQPQLQIERAYTPLPPSPGDGEITSRRELRLLVRHEPNGEVSGYLHKLSVGAQLDLRGPLIEFEIPEDVDEILFLAGGTGIAPALQVAHNLYCVRKDSHPPAKLHILWANRKREDCEGGVNDGPIESRSWLTRWPFYPVSPNILTPQAADSADSSSSSLMRLLHHFRQRQAGQFSIDYFIDEEQKFINEKTLRLTLQKLQDNIDKPLARRKIVLISGPDGFVEHMAGPKDWANGREVQGLLGGLLSQISHPGWEIWKL